VGETIAYSYLVTNTGNVTLKTVSVDDPTLGSVTCPAPAAPGLAPGGSETCTGDTPHTVTQADVDAGKVVDTATSSGVSTQNIPGTPSAPIHGDCPLHRNADRVDREVGGGHPDGRPSRLKVGDKVAYSYVVTNTHHLEVGDDG
jgi:hypothetical protein